MVRSSNVSKTASYVSSSPVDWADDSSSLGRPLDIASCPSSHSKSKSVRMLAESTGRSGTGPTSFVSDKFRDRKVAVRIPTLQSVFVRFGSVDIEGTRKGAEASTCAAFAGLTL